AIIGAAFVIGLQVAAILSYGTLSRADVLQSKALEALTPDLSSVFWWPARAALGDMPALAAVLAASLILLTAVIALVAPRFGDYAIAASGDGASPAARTRRAKSFRVASPRAPRRPAAPRTPPQGMAAAPPRSLASLADADADALSAPARDPVVAHVRSWRRRAQPPGAGIVMAAGQRAGGLAWLSISGEDAPNL